MEYRKSIRHTTTKNLAPLQINLLIRFTYSSFFFFLFFFLLKTVSCTSNMKSWSSKKFIFLIIMICFHTGKLEKKDNFLSDVDYFPYETYGEAMMECVYLMSSQREHVLEAERELLNNYGISEDYEARQLMELFRSTEVLINQTFNALCVRLQSELKPNERYDPINDRTFARLAHTWNEVRRYMERRVENVDESALLLRISGAAEREMSKTYNFMKNQIKKLRARGY